MNRTLVAAAGIWLLPVVLLACGNDKGADTGGAPLDAIDVVDLGSYSVKDTGDFTGDVTVEIPEGASSVMAYCSGYGDAQLGKVWYLTTPDGTKVYDGDVGDESLWRSDWTDDMATSLIPMTPKLGLSAGTWTFNWWIGANNPGSVDCKAVIRLDEPGDTATITVDLVFVGLDGLDATTAPDDVNFQAALAQFETQWSDAGLVPSYNYRDFAGDVNKFAVVDVTDDDFSEFNDLLRTASPANDRTLTFFLVQEISNATSGGTTLGKAGGPPGAAAVSRTSKSGVVVSAIDYDSAPEDVGKIMAHEGGHFLGLWHTTEAAGDHNDPIADTPECPLSADTNGNGTLNTTECAGQGAENVMWWTLQSGTASMTSDQGWVIRRSPAAN